MRTVDPSLLGPALHLVSQDPGSEWLVQFFGVESTLGMRREIT